ncbi:hypothetical protein CBS101457_000249 [Exobasidium rhododendri]|nr:hypothetical protein CBS101457_000249 [Exobasidium rhododendri]
MNPDGSWSNDDLSSLNLGSLRTRGNSRGDLSSHLTPLGAQTSRARDHSNLAARMGSRTSRPARQERGKSRSRIHRDDFDDTPNFPSYSGTEHDPHVYDQSPAMINQASMPEVSHFDGQNNNFGIPSPSQFDTNSFLTDPHAGYTFTNPYSDTFDPYQGAAFSSLAFDHGPMFDQAPYYSQPVHQEWHGGTSSSADYGQAIHPFLGSSSSSSSYVNPTLYRSNDQTQNEASLGLSSPLGHPHTAVPRPVQAPTIMKYRGNTATLVDLLDLYTESLSREISIGYQWTNPHELCWGFIDKNSAEEVVRQIKRENNHQKGGIVKKLQRRLTPTLALALLSGRRDLIDEAMQVIYVSEHPYHQVELGNVDERPEWRKMLSDTEAHTLVKRLGEISGQNDAFIREWLVEHGVGASTAQRLLHCKTEERSRWAVQAQLVTFIEEESPEDIEMPINVPSVKGHTVMSSLMTPDDDYYQPWKEGTSKWQRAVIIPIVMRLFDNCSATKANDILRRSQVKAGRWLGLRILKTALEEGDEAAGRLFMGVDGI